MAAAAVAKSLQSCPTLCDPIDGSLPGSPVPGILQARILEWVAFPSPGDLPDNSSVSPARSQPYPFMTDVCAKAMCMGVPSHFSRV